MQSLKERTAHAVKWVPLWLMQAIDLFLVAIMVALLVGLAVSLVSALGPLLGWTLVVAMTLVRALVSHFMQSKMP